MKPNTITIIVPSHNEENILEQNIKKLHNYLKIHFKLDFKIIIADGNSHDKTRVIAENLCKKYKKIKYFKIDKNGKGFAIKSSQNKYNSDWYCFIDCDLPVPLRFFNELEKKIFDEKYDLIIGCRHCKKGKLIGSLPRKIVSLGYLNLARTILFNFKIKDLQTGFKAWNNKIKKEVFPLIKDKSWFFDTELVYYSYKKKKKITYLPVIYYLDPKTKNKRKTNIKLLKDSWYFFRKLIQLKLKNIF